MTIYTFSQARQNFATVLNRALKEGKVLIKRKDGSSFVIKPIKKTKAPLDVDGIDLGLSNEEIVDVIREIRER